MSDVEPPQRAGDPPPPAPQPRSGLLVPWPILALVLGLTTVSSIATLVIVATAVDADALATVALVIAILSFGAQLIVTAAQTASANEQYRQVNRLYEDTRAVLQRIRVQSKMLLSNQSDQFDKILDHVLSPGAIESAVAEARGESDTASSPSVDPAEPTADVNEVSKLLRAEAERQFDERSRRVATRPPASRDDQIARFPSAEEASNVLPRFSRLSDDAKNYIRDIAERFNRNPRIGVRRTQVLPGEIAGLPSHFRELEDAGFVILEPIRSDGKTNTGRRLTPDGLIAIRFFTGQGVVPGHLRDIFEVRGTADGSTDKGAS